MLMDEIKVYDNLYMYRSGGGNMPITFNQYLLLGAEPILIHTGGYRQALELLPKLKNRIGDNTLSYIFISHFESDECGGLNLIMDSYPGAVPVCSSVTARQIAGFGYNFKLLVKEPGAVLETREYKLQFIGYPSEVHLWEGLLAYETVHKLLFCSDLFVNMEKVDKTQDEASLPALLDSILKRQIPSPGEAEKLKKELSGLDIEYAGPGHGPFLKLK